MKPGYSIELAEKSLRLLSHYKLHILVLYYLSKRAPHQHPPHTAYPRVAAFALIKFKSNYHLDFMPIKPSLSVTIYTQCKGTRPPR
jgi:hypothetical protein